MEVLATGYISLVDINDAIVSDVPPADPSLGALWIDTTKDPNTLSSWDGTNWIEQSLSISSLDPSFYQDVEKLKDFADKAGSDGIISSGEKANIKLILLEITGDTLSGQTLPTIATIDTAKGGQVYLARAEARASGIPITHVDYTAFETAYSDLKTYLESLTPRPWLTGDTTIDPVTWTAKWDAYYEKLSRLAVATSTYLANSIRPGEDYNGVTINTDKGIVVLRGDGLFRTILNATEGISIEKNNAGTWNKMFYTNLDGKIYANGLVVSSDSTIAGTDAATIKDNAAKGKAGIDELTSDLKVTPLEKTQLSREWESIKAEYTQVLAQATALGVVTSTYTTSYTNLDGVTPKIAAEVLATMTTTYTFASASARDAFRTKINSYFAESEKIKKAINDTINKSANTANDKIDNLKVGGQNIVRKKQLMAVNAASSSFDDATNTWTITGNDGAGGSWGAGVRITGQFSVIPIGSWFTVSFDVYSPVDITWNNDTNNFPIGTTSGTNDNDEVALRKNSGRNIKANTWTRCWFSYKNKDNSTTELYDQSNIGVVNNTGAPLTFKIRNVKGELGSVATDFSLSQADIDDSIAKVQDNLDKLSVGGKNLLLESNMDFSTTDYLIKMYSLSEDWITGQEYTFVIKGTVPAGQKFGIWQNGGSNKVGEATTTYVNGVTYVTFKAIATTTGNERKLSLYNFPQNTTLSTVDWVALYKGNKPMDWSPAPEDVSTMIDVAYGMSPNIILNSGFLQGLKFWKGIGQNVSLDTTLDLGGIPIIKSIQTGVATNQYRGLETDLYPAPFDKQLTFSVYSFAPDLTNIDAGLTLELKCYDKDRNRLTPLTYAIDCLPSKSGSWERFSKTISITDKNVMYVNIFFYVRRNGTGYFSRPMLQVGNVLGSWSPNPNDVIMDGLDETTQNSKNAIADMTSDMKVTPLEKNQLSRDWEAIKAEYAQVLALAQSTSGVSTSAYSTAYTNLDGSSPKLASEILVNMNTTYSFSSTSARDLFKTQMNAYFNEAEKIKKAISDGINDANRELAQAISTGRMVFTDPIFKNGLNGIGVYNNAGNSNVTVSRVVKPSDAPTTSTHVLEVKTIGTASPSHGGFVQSINSRAGAKILFRIIAKIPVGYTLGIAANSMGDGARDRLITSNKGTGNYEEYIRLINCGTTGTFSSTGHFYLMGGSTATPEAPVTWQVAYATAYDVGDADYTVIDNKDKWDNAANNANNALKQGQAVINSTFSNWTGSFPDGLGSWSGSSVSKETTLTRTGSAMRFNVGADTTQIGATILPGFFIPNLPNNKYYALELDFMLVSGSITGACVLLDWQGMNPSRTSIHLSDVEPSPALGKWYTVRAVMKRPTDTLTGYTGMAGYLLANYSGSTTNKVKNIVFDRLVFREPTQQEIDAYEITTIENGVTVIDGGKLKTNSVKAESVDARRLRVTNNSGTVTLEITGAGEVTVNGKVSINSNSMFAPGYDPSKNDGGRNILLNSRFSTADATNWTNWGSPSVRQVEDITDLPGFDKAVKFTTTANNQGLNQTVSVVNGNTYTLSCYAKSSSGQPVLQVYDGVGYPSVVMNSADVGKNKWVKMYFVFTAKASTVRLDMGKSAGGTLGTYWFTGIKLEEGDKTTGWTPANEDIDGLIGKVVTPNGDIKALDIASSMSVTPGAIDVVSKNINLKGKVTFSDFASGWALDSKGNKISNSDQPGYDPAKPLYLDMDGNYRPLSDEKNFMSNLFTKDDTNGVTVIDGNYIKTGTIQAKYANFRDVQVYNDSGQLTFHIDTNGNLSTSGTSQSIGYERQKKGWKIDADGSAEFNAATFRGDIELGYYNAPTDSFVVTGGLLSSIGGTGKDLRFWAGANKSTAPFKVFSDGTLEATKGYFTGTFSGEVVVGNISIRDTATKGDAKIILTDDSKIQKVVLGESAVELNTKTTFGNFLTVDITNQKLDFGANDFGIDYKNNTIRMKSFSLKGTTALEFVSDGSSGDDFVFKNVTGDTSVRVDGSFIARDDIEITNVLRMKKSTDSGNKGIDYVFI
ncbi:TPA: carbohydrate binding domain-containing protein [Bacillus toyonensis]|nr:carbohydrate binding domain-containing protein [Bacillus toyonensis]